MATSKRRWIMRKSEAKRSPDDNRECRECGKRTPEGKSQISLCCRDMRLCRYCYRAKFPVHRQRRRTDGRRELAHPLSRGDRIWHEEHAFEGMEQLIWSKDFLAEWREYIKARKRGEL